MGILLLAVYLVIVGLQTLVHVAIPDWVTGILALIAGIVLLFENRGVITR